MQLLCKTVIHGLDGTHLQCINKNMVSLSVCCDAITVRYDQGGSHLLCKNNKIVRLKVYRGQTESVQCVEVTYGCWVGVKVL